MSGTRIGGYRAADTNRKRHGEDFYAVIGAKGGSVVHPETRPFRTNRELARLAGYRGGLTSRRKK